QPMEQSQAPYPHILGPMTTGAQISQQYIQPQLPQVAQPPQQPQMQAGITPYTQMPGTIAGAQNCNNTSPGGISHTIYNRAMGTNAQPANQANNTYSGYNGQIMMHTAPGQSSEKTSLPDQNYIADLIQQMQTQMTIRLSAIDQNMSKLNNIESDISVVRSEMCSLKHEQLDVKSKVGECQQYCESINSVCEDYLRTKATTSDDILNLRSENASMKNELSDLRRDNGEIRDKLLEMQCRSMTDNLLFFGVAEERRGYRDTRENTELVLKSFLRCDELKYEDNINVADFVGSLQFERVHRLGRQRTDESGNLLRPRPIVAKFTRFKDRETVRVASMGITDRKYSVREQFPMEIEHKRKILYPVLRIAKNDPTVREVNLVRDKLYIDGKQYHPRQANDRPPNIPPPAYNHNHRRDMYNAPIPPIDNEWRYRNAHAQPNQPGATNRAQQTPGIGQLHTPVRSFADATRFSSMNDGDIMETDSIFPATTNARKKKATSPLMDQQSPKKQRETGIFSHVQTGQQNCDVIPTITGAPGACGDSNDLPTVRPTPATAERGPPRNSESPTRTFSPTSDSVTTDNDSHKDTRDTTGSQ
ncbi:MAG: hypothetical protein ABW185_19960, partial [Sedimenticola sp.]